LLEVLTWEMVAAGIAFIFLLRSLAILIGIWGMARSVKLTWGYCGGLYSGRQSPMLIGLAGLTTHMEDSHETGRGDGDRVGAVVAVISGYHGSRS
jgi:hypothetical protein